MENNAEFKSLIAKYITTCDIVDEAKDKLKPVKAEQKEMSDTILRHMKTNNITQLVYGKHVFQLQTRKRKIRASKDQMVEKLAKYISDPDHALTVYYDLLDGGKKETEVLKKSAKI